MRSESVSGVSRVRCDVTIFFIVENTRSLQLEEAGVAYTLIATLYKLGYVVLRACQYLTTANASLENGARSKSRR